MASSQTPERALRWLLYAFLIFSLGVILVAVLAAQEPQAGLQGTLEPPHDPDLEFKRAYDPEGGVICYVHARGIACVQVTNRGCGNDPSYGGTMTIREAR